MTTLRTRVPLVLAVVAAAAIAAGAALARTKPAPVGTGIVVIETGLGYEGGAAAGTGMVLTANGEVLTNNHVIAGSTTVRVVVPHTTHRYTGRVVGYDVADDVAVVQLQSASNLKTVRLGDSSRLKVGAHVTALGNALGAGTIASAPGKITGLGKSITASNDQGGTEQLTGLIETDAPLQPGDSGGPLVDASGRVIGMDTAASTGFAFTSARAGDAYAIPSRTAARIAALIVAGKSSATVHVGPTAFLGVQVQAAAAGGGFGTTTPTPGGALIAGVVSGGPAATAGLVPGDTITSFDGRPVSTPTDITAVILTLKPGTAIPVSYTDQTGAAQTATVTLGSGPPQ